MMVIRSRLQLELVSQVLHQRVQPTGECGPATFHRPPSQVIQVLIESFQHSRRLYPHRLGDRVLNFLLDSPQPCACLLHLVLELLGSADSEFLENHVHSAF